MSPRGGSPGKAISLLFQTVLRSKGGGWAREETPTARPLGSASGPGTVTVPELAQGWRQDLKLSLPSRESLSSQEDRKRAQTCMTLIYIPITLYGLKRIFDPSFNPPKSLWGRRQHSQSWMYLSCPSFHTLIAHLYVPKRPMALFCMF